MLRRVDLALVDRMAIAAGKEYDKRYSEVEEDMSPCFRTNPSHLKLGKERCAELRRLLKVAEQPNSSRDVQPQIAQE